MSVRLYVIKKDVIFERASIKVCFYWLYLMFWYFFIAH